MFNIEFSLVLNFVLVCSRLVPRVLRLESMNNVSKKILAVMSFLFSLSAVAGSISTAGLETNHYVDIKRGATLFSKYCTLCHGNDGLGEGLLVMRLGNYPSTNLLAVENKFTSSDDIYQAIALGGFDNKMNLDELMPPYKDELSETDISAIARFIQFLRYDTPTASKILQQSIAVLPMRRDAGRVLFNTHCSLCHGETGDGRGRMGKILRQKKMAFPTDLSKSRLSNDELFEMITKGGNAMARSSFMPSWSEQLTIRQRQVIIEHINNLRGHPKL